MMKEAAHYVPVEGGARVRCGLCPHNCLIDDGKTGICGVRANRKGKLYSEIYGEVTSIAVDPIEKKPLYHFHPGTPIISAGTKGCNFMCSFCQNWSISQDVNARSEYYSPEELINLATSRRSHGVAYTYSEPMIWFEYVLDCAMLAHRKGLYNVLVTNGYVNPAPLDELLAHVDAMNIDLKSFRSATYRKVQKGGLDDVLATIRTASKRCHVELTTLVVTGINDDIGEMRDIINWIAGLDRSIPWHISRYYPNYKYDAPATDIDFMLKVCDEAMNRLDYVYCGNIAGSYGHSDTLCPSCKKTVIRRTGYHVKVEALEGTACAHCGARLKIVV